MKPEQEKKDYRKIETLGDIVYHKKHGAGRIITMSDWTYSMETGVTFFNGSRVDCYIGIDGMDHRDLVPIEVGIHQMLAALEEAQQQAKEKNQLWLKATKGWAITEESLAEAQQTIARQHNLFQNIKNLSYIDGPAYSAIRVYVDLALGNKEGEVQP